MDYARLNRQFDVCDPTEGSEEHVRYGFGTGEDFKGIKYTDFKVEDRIYSDLINIVPMEIRDEFETSLITINGNISPHVDSNFNTVINVYIENGGYITSFCTPNEGVAPGKLPAQTNGVIYEFEDVTIYDSFFALPGEIYILDVTKIHCVHTPCKGSRRLALNLSTKIPFNEVVQYMRR